MLKATFKKGIFLSILVYISIFSSFTVVIAIDLSKLYEYLGIQFPVEEFFPYASLFVLRF